MGLGGNPGKGVVGPVGAGVTEVVPALLCVDSCCASSCFSSVVGAIIVVGGLGISSADSVFWACLHVVGIVSISDLDRNGMYALYCTRLTCLPPLGRHFHSYLFQ